jgi:ferritin-like metal-binding protein YciE
MGKLIADEPRMFYVTGLHNARAMETQAIELLTRQTQRLEHYPEMAERLAAHLAESKVQRARLEDVLATHDETHSAIKEAILGLGGNIAALAHTTASDEIIKNTLANYMFEHFEIAAYKSLIAMAEFLGDAPAIATFTESLREERAMAQWIDDHIAPTTILFLDRVKSGVTADH